jgi:hypothetical protein
LKKENNNDEVYSNYSYKSPAEGSSNPLSDSGSTGDGPGGVHNSQGKKSETVSGSKKELRGVVMDVVILGGPICSTVRLFIYMCVCVCIYLLLCLHLCSIVLIIVINIVIITIITTIIITATTITTIIVIQSRKWKRARQMTAGRLINGFSTNDLVLAISYR